MVIKVPRRSVNREIIFQLVISVGHVNYKKDKHDEPKSEIAPGMNRDIKELTGEKCLLIF